MKTLIPTLFLLACFACSKEESQDALASEEASIADCCAEDGLEIEDALAEIGLDAESIYQLPTKFTDTEGKTRVLADFRGKPVVIAMIFTHCEYACPVIIEDLGRFESALSEGERNAANWLLISFDAERDTPEVLAEYAKNNELDPSRWTLLHADAAGVREAAAVLGVRYKQTPTGSFSHANRITVLDQAGRIHKRLDGLNVDVSPGVAALQSLLTTDA
jgi:protein SCO1/2